MGNLAANYANLRKILTAEILNRKDLIESQSVSDTGHFFNHGWTRINTDFFDRMNRISHKASGFAQGFRRRYSYGATGRRDKSIGIRPHIFFV